jgi:hypothetical protein
VRTLDAECRERLRRPQHASAAHTSSARARSAIRCFSRAVRRSLPPRRIGALEIDAASDGTLCRRCHRAYDRGGLGPTAARRARASARGSTRRSRTCPGSPCCGASRACARHPNNQRTKEKRWDMDSPTATARSACASLPGTPSGRPWKTIRTRSTRRSPRPAVKTRERSGTRPAQTAALNSADGGRGEIASTCPPVWASQGSRPFLCLTLQRRDHSAAGAIKTAAGRALRVDVGSAGRSSAPVRRQGAARGGGTRTIEPRYRRLFVPLPRRRLSLMRAKKMSVGPSRAAGWPRANAVAKAPRSATSV